ncbi:MAG TPA: PQQ-binding-like beta-propeller repeat protein [Acidimicrobiales bacterium]|nr:PQQ-binding-like beta-propeller repeat protein [Acidimicrobiales bacterium]
MAKTSHACTNCGAALAIPARHDRYFSCRFCGSVLEDTTPPEQQGAGAITIRLAESTSIDASELISYAAPAARTAGRVMVIVTLVILAVSAAGIFVAVRAVTDSTTQNAEAKTADGEGIEIFNYATATVVASDTSTGPDLVAVSRGPDGDRVIYADLDAETPFRWSVGVGLEADVFTQFVVDDELVVLTSESTLVALNRATGTEAWRASLTDKLQPNICSNCLAAFGDDVVTLTVDGVLTAHVRSTGEQRWSVTLTDTPRQIVDFGGSPAVLDAGDDGQVFLEVHDSTTGALSRSVALTCPDPTFGGRRAVSSVFETLHPVENGVVFFGDPVFGPCVQRIDPPGDGPTWETPFASQEGLDPSPEEVLVTGGALIQTADGNVAAVDLSTGATRSILTIDDGDVFPVAADSRVVVVVVESTRGSGSHQLRAIDLATGNIKWTFDLASTDRLERGNGMSISGDAWAADLTSVGLSVLQYREADDEIVLQTIPLESGTASAPVTIGLTGFGFSANPSVVGWTGDTLHLLVDGTILGVDATTGKITNRAP